MRLGKIGQIQHMPIQHFIFMTLLKWSGVIFRANLIRFTHSVDTDTCYLILDKMKEVREINTYGNVLKVSDTVIFI